MAFGRRTATVGVALTVLSALLAGCTPTTGGGPSAAGSAAATAPPAGTATARPAPRPSAPRASTPHATPRASATPRRSATPTGCPVGDHQRAVEEDLARLGGFGRVTVDGVQTPADCAAIIRFQRRYGISPAEGRAGPTTAAVADRLVATRADRCAAGAGTTVCIDLTRQTIWVQRGGTVLLGPTVTRTGMAGYATPTGWYHIYQRAAREWSQPYHVWMPYWQRFNGGIGLHETTTYLHDGSIGSHGCVNLLPADAVTLWRLAGIGTAVHVFGRRPGT